MSLYLAPILIGTIGVLIAHLLSRAPELRPMRLSQLILVPSLLVFAFCISTNFITYIATISLLGLLLAPNIGFYCGQSLWDFLDPKDWTPLDAEIELRQVQRMIERDQFHEALEELERLLKTHRPTYEALWLKTKLLHHFGSVDETMSVLFQMIGLCKDTQQHVAVMEAIHLLEPQYQGTRNIASGVQEIRIGHELMLFQTDANDRSVHRIVPAGTYKVEGIFQGECRWFKLAGENWGNAVICWEAVKARKVAEQPSRNVLGTIARMHRTIGMRLTWRMPGKRRSEKSADDWRRGKDFHIHSTRPGLALKQAIWSNTNLIGNSP